ncbi:hypothetical protein ASH01_06665 [Terrabacter sp. Soil811]|uniref:AAA family ATPase n=1 Tax=Terrabacter sp. Soil811 TaxID=1736419 RepID=UPI0006F28F28|nr:ATP-binding protein [Terrabacter sp. Soil811]KRF45504.1 hypothetical protein ASH01_06665 [Terrabacter sp. Soil811]
MSGSPSGRTPVVTAEDVRARLAQRASARSAPSASRPRPTAPEASGAAAAPSSTRDVEPAATGPTSDAAAPDPARQRLRERVALLDYFTVDALEGRTTRETPRHQEIDGFIGTDCELVTTRSGGGAWRLRPEVRADVLRSLGPGRAVALTTGRWAVAPAPDDVTHRMAVRLIHGDTTLRALAPAELTGILKAAVWLEGLGLDLPAAADVQSALDLANVLTPLRAVSTPDFVGREVELAQLEAHVMGGPGGLPLALHGPGGVGKSTLLATFVLDHIEGTDARPPMPFAYLSFERAELDPEFPIGLIAEVCRQLALQSTDLAGPLGELRREIVAVVEAEAALQRETSSSRGLGTKDAVRRHVDEDSFLMELSQRLRRAWGSKPVLVVLDTFEVAQRRRRSTLGRLNRTLQSLQRQLPSLRVVVAGRAEVTELQVENRPLEGLDDTQARQFLRRAVADLAVTDALVDSVVEQVSGNPLSLRLAADLMRREGPSVLATKRGRRRLLFDLRAEQVQGVLYRRILDHVARPIRPLANPGLVVRQITREVISDVLAVPCGLGELAPERAAELFEMLRGEVSLVTESRPGVLVHRADVRQEMLPLLDAESPERVAEIHRRAVAFYGARSGTDDRIEGLYHRLMLGQASSTLDAHWDRGAGPFLEPAMSELPPSSRVYLAGKLRLEVDAADLAEADYTAWARQATKQARSLLDSGRPAAAWDLLAADDRRPRLVEVSRLRIEALATLGRHEEAMAEVDAAVSAAEERPLSLDYIELCIVGGRVAEDAGDLDRAARLFVDARESATDFGARSAALTAGVGVLRMVRRQGGLGSQSATRRLRGELIAEAAGLTEQDKASHPGLVRELAAELGDAVPSLLADASLHVGVTSAGDDASGHDASTLDVIQANIRRTIESDPTIGPTDRDLDEDEEETAPDVGDLSSAVQGHALAEAVKALPDDLDLRESVKKYWQGEADRPSFDYNADS